MKTNSYYECLIPAAIMSWAQTGYAQTPPGAVPVGFTYAYPELEVAVRRDSNIAIQPAATSGTIYYLRPSVRLEAKQDADMYNLGYRDEYGRYNHQTTDNFENHELFADANMALDMRNNLKVRLNCLDRIDPRGTPNVAATPTPNRWHQPSITGLYAYGVEDAAGRLELERGYFDKRYVNNRFVTFALDYNRTDYGGTFLWRVQPKTYLTFNLRQSAYDYKDPTITLDSKDTFMPVCGVFGQRCQERARRLLERGWVTVLASDAHAMAVRMPELEPGRAAAENIVGEAESWRFVRERPAAITAGNPGFGEGG